MNYQQQAWNNGQSESEKVQTNLNLGGQLPALFLGDANLHGEGTRNGAWQISGSNLLAVLESESFVVLCGMGAEAKTPWRRCCPGGYASKASGDLQGKASIDILDGSQADASNSKWIGNQKLTIDNLGAWDNVAQPNQGQHKTQPERSFNQVTKSKEEGLAERQASKQQGRDGYDIAGSWSFVHSQIDSSKGAKK